MIFNLAAASVPLLLAALGALLSERAGVLNISLEGCIGAGAFTTVLLIQLGIPVVPALIAAVVIGSLLGALLGAVSVGLGANPFIAGLGINLLAPSLTGLISQLIMGHKGTIRLPEETLESFTTSGVPLVSILAILLVPAVAFLLSGSSFGRQIRAAGNDSGFLAERGFSTGRIRMLTLIISSGAAALAGAYIALRIGAWVPGLSAGRGWIALVIIWLGFKRPSGILIAAYFFSLMEIISGQMQGRGGISPTLFLALPYLTALLALALTTMEKRRRNK